MTNVDKRNAEGYFDPTPYLALSKIEREEQILRQLKKVLNDICGLAGFRIKGQIVFVEKRTGHSRKI